jgi:hypothetical protein
MHHVIPRLIPERQEILAYGVKAPECHSSLSVRLSVQLNINTNIQIVSFSKFSKIIVDFFTIFLLGILAMIEAAANDNLSITPDN